MSSLKLITTEKFGDLDCNFYRNMNDDILLTREQIGKALEYADPINAIYRIHKRHSNRLDNLSICLSDGLGHEVFYYNERGVMEICRWSNSKKANQFMDWVWNIVEKYRNRELNNTLNLQPLLDTLTVLTQSMTSMQQDINTLKNSQPQKQLSASKYSRWKSNVFNKFRLLQSYVNENSDQELSLPMIMKLVFDELQDTYDVDLTEYTDMYKCEYGIDFSVKVQTLDVINHYRDIRELFKLTLNSILERLHIQEENNYRNIFDILADRQKK